MVCEALLSLTTFNVNLMVLLRSSNNSNIKHAIYKICFISFKIFENKHTVKCCNENS